MERTPARPTGPELTNPRAGRVMAARRLGKRALRNRERRFLAEGPQAVREALRRSAAEPDVVIEVYAMASVLDRHDDLWELAREADVPLHLVSGEVFAALAQTVTPQGVVAVCRFVDVPLPEMLAARPELVAVLTHVRDPGNAGTVIRCADAAGAGGVLLTEASVDPYNPKGVRASAGSLFHLPVSSGVAAGAGLAALREQGLRILGADGTGETDLDEAADRGLLAGPTAWVFGNEAWGLTNELRDQVDNLVRVPIYGRAESLNLATAAAVCLYATARAQRDRFRK